MARVKNELSRVGDFGLSFFFSLSLVAQIIFSFRPTRRKKINVEKMTNFLFSLSLVFIKLNSHFLSKQGQAIIKLKKGTLSQKSVKPMRNQTEPYKPF